MWAVLFGYALSALGEHSRTAAPTRHHAPVKKGWLGFDFNIICICSRKFHIREGSMKEQNPNLDLVVWALDFSVFLSMNYELRTMNFFKFQESSFLDRLPDIFHQFSIKMEIIPIKPYSEGPIHLEIITITKKEIPFSTNDSIEAQRKLPNACLRLMYYSSLSSLQTQKGIYYFSLL